MERPQRKRLRLESYDYSQPGSYFITICTRERNQEVLCSIEPAVGAIINRPRRGSRKFPPHRSKQVAAENQWKRTLATGLPPSFPQKTRKYKNAY